MEKNWSFWEMTDQTALISNHKIETKLFVYTQMMSVKQLRWQDRLLSTLKEVAALGLPQFKASLP